MVGTNDCVFTLQNISFFQRFSPKRFIFVRRFAPKICIFPRRFAPKIYIFQALRAQKSIFFSALRADSVREPFRFVFPPSLQISEVPTTTVGETGEQNLCDSALTEGV